MCLPSKRPFARLRRANVRAAAPEAGRCVVYADCVSAIEETNRQVDDFENI